jgi:hypothetical protein
MALGSIFLRWKLQCCHVSHGPGGPWTIGIKKGLAVLGMQLGSRVSKTCSCITEALADVQAATVYPYSVASAQLTTPEHGYSGDTTRQDGTTVRDMLSTTGWQATRPGVPTSLKTSFATPSHSDPRYCIGFQPPRGHLSGPGSQCNCPTLSYKKLGQTPL